MVRKKLLALPAMQKKLLQVLADLLLIWCSIWLALAWRLGMDGAWSRVQEHLWLFIAVPLLTIPLFARMGMYRTVVRYLGWEALKECARALTLAIFGLALLIYLVQTPDMVHLPRSFVLLYWFISMVCLCGLRIVVRLYFMGDLMHAGLQLFSLRFLQKDLPRVAIYGAGSQGNQLVQALRIGRSMRPVAFVDDNEGIAGRIIAGLRVYHPNQLEEMLLATGAAEILLAIPSAPRARRQEILSMLESYPVRVRSVPGFMDLVSGRVKVQELQEVDIADLLGRETVDPDSSLFERCIRGQVVMVTGAGGSIGAELCRQILTSGATMLILYEHSEYNLYHIHSELQKRIREEALKVELLPILGSIRNPVRLLEVMQAWRVNTIYHAAAYKHVPMVEHNTSEGILNNVMGTLHTAQAAIVAGVPNFVLVSTDKAVRPTNVMGSSKRLAEMVLQALSQEKSLQLFRGGLLDGSLEGFKAVNRTRFTMVRFGNVLGSSGSVIPLFRQQIREGGPVTVTHPEITRYFMTIPEAAQLVIQAGSMGQGGDVFVLDMGEPVRIIDLAEKMVRLSGLTLRTEENPKGDIAIKFTGLRPGEKLYEELLIGDNVTQTEHRMIMRANEDMIPWNELCDVLHRMQELINHGDSKGIRMLLLDVVAGYSPQCEIVDLLHGNHNSAVEEQAVAVGSD